METAALLKLTRITKVRVWNVRGINEKEEEPVQEMKKVNIQILGISGTKKKNSGIMILRDSYVIGWGGVDSKTHARAVVAVIINKERENDIIDIKYINERTITLEMALCEAKRTKQEVNNEEKDQDLEAERFDSKESYHKEHNRTKWRERDIHRYRSKMEEPQRENKKKQQVRLRSEIGI
ncbi:hypothetical protein ILUMI_12248 [Ignelater luminosus]|uniref:Uncharacterized protein n=1 Tax=Ignelater luminosus TaxID=2038154 RepID=A0A8K0GD49_IGNLU|nr:hypothetical protein ILUMI_12248 [Ignelater luminosus]